MNMSILASRGMSQNANAGAAELAVTAFLTLLLPKFSAPLNRMVQSFVSATMVVALTACATVRVFPENGNNDATLTTRVPNLQDSKTVIIQRGDTIYGVASRLGVNAYDLASWNGISSPYTIHPGQRLRVQPLFPRASEAKGSDQVGTSMPSDQQSTIDRSSPSVAGPSLTPRSSSAIAPLKERKHWRWPADGPVVVPVAAPNAPFTPGLNIAGRSGEPVRAVDDGVVLYSGSGSSGYEELIVIEHDDKWVSSYSHNRKRLVGEGQRIKAGMQIAEMGRTGVPREMVRLELRHGGAPVDPLLYLPKR